MGVACSYSSANRLCHKGPHRKTLTKLKMCPKISKMWKHSRVFQLAKKISNDSVPAKYKYQTNWPSFNTKKVMA